MINTISLKLIDKIVGRCLCSLLPRPKSEKLEIIKKLMIIRPGGIGDAVLLAPVINSLRTSYPDCHIDILAEQRNAGVFPLVLGVTKVLCYDRPLELFQALRGSYDVIIDTEQWYFLSAVVARLIRSPLKIGFGTNKRRRMFTHCIQYDLDAHEPENFLVLLKPLEVDCQLAAGTATLSLPLQSMSRASQLLHPLSSDPFVVIFPGASISEKRWGADRFSQVSKRLADAGYKVVVVGGREDHSDGDRIAGSEGLNLAGMTSLAETAAVIARSRLMICGDSGVLHLAVGLGIPTVSLFGPSSTSKWAPKGSNHIVLNRNLTCSPCSKFGTAPPCPIDAGCIRDIMPVEVTEAVGRLLSSPTEEKKI